MRAGRALLSLCLCGLLASPASHAEDFEWDWDVSMGLGYFSFRNSLFRDIQPDPPDDLGESWMEFYFKPGIEMNWELRKLK